MQINNFVLKTLPETEVVVCGIKYFALRPKIKYFFIFPYQTDPLKLALTQKCFTDLKMIFFFPLPKFICKNFDLEGVSLPFCYFLLCFYCKI